MYDVIIIGAGPAGIFAALELVKEELKVMLIDMGPDIDKRICPANRGLECIKCEPCLLLNGWGGAGAFSDGKLTLSTKIGGWLNEYINEEKLESLIKYVDETYVKYGASTKLYGVEIDKIEELSRKTALAGLKLIPSKIRHLGTENCSKILARIKNYLEKKVELKFNTQVKDLIVKNGKVTGVLTAKNEHIESKYVIVAPGRAGAEWLSSIAKKFNLKTLNNPVDIGVRVEVSSSILEELTSILYEPKLIYSSKMFDDQVRTFCFNPYGEVITESYKEVITVNGQSYAERKTENTNFAILVSTSFTEPFKEPIAYGKYIARLANLLSGGIIIQRLGDLMLGRRSTEERIKRSLVNPTLKAATPGDLSFALPYRYLANIKEMLKAMNQICPGIYSKHTLLYGVEVKFYSSRLKLNQNFEVENLKNLFAIGDGAGITRGLIQASISGVVAAQEIIKRERKKEK
ncbi:MAG: NAD(P)/FAD-dependent oxidoreductase [Candidatus Bathyarchaeia archaeon]|nr:NAD(P)/FAD-dependent oxidoreductase [Candidatus Bathyarchaeota archaeon]